MSPHFDRSSTVDLPRSPGVSHSTDISLPSGQKDSSHPDGKGTFGSDDWSFREETTGMRLHRRVAYTNVAVLITPVDP